MKWWVLDEVAMQTVGSWRLWWRSTFGICGKAQGAQTWYIHKLGMYFPQLTQDVSSTTVLDYPVGNCLSRQLFFLIWVFRSRKLTAMLGSPLASRSCHWQLPCQVDAKCNCLRCELVLGPHACKLSDDCAKAPMLSAAGRPNNLGTTSWRIICGPVASTCHSWGWLAH